MLTATDKAILDSSNPTNQQVKSGTELYDASVSGVYYLPCSITSDATGGKAVIVPFACEIVDVIVQCRASNGSGTALVKVGASAITDAIIMAVDKTMTKAGTIDDAHSTLAAGAAVTVTANGAGDKGLVLLVVRKV